MLAFHASLLAALGSAPAHAGNANTLPLRQGYYVSTDTACNNASEATITLVARYGTGSEHELERFKKIVPAGPGVWRVTYDLIDDDTGRHQETATDTYKITSPTAYSVVNGNGSYAMRYCPQASLPDPWNTNNISKLINPAAGGAIPSEEPAVPAGPGPATAAAGRVQATAQWSVSHSPSGSPVARLSLTPGVPIRAIELACLDRTVALGVLTVGPSNLTGITLVLSPPDRTPLSLAVPRRGTTSTFAVPLGDTRLVDALAGGAAVMQLAVGRLQIGINPAGAATTLRQGLAGCYTPPAAPATPSPATGRSPAGDEAGIFAAVRSEYLAFENDNTKPLRTPGFNAIWATCSATQDALEKKAPDSSFGECMEEGSPVCQCQDGDFALMAQSLKVAITPLSPGVVRATATFYSSRSETGKLIDSRTVYFRVVRVAEGWRVDDVLAKTKTGKFSSELRAPLLEGIARMRRKLKLAPWPAPPLALPVR